MSRLDGTGPQGQGALSGRRLGDCDGARMGQGWRLRQGQRQRKGRAQGEFCQRFRLAGAGEQGISLQSLHAQISSLRSSIEQLKAMISQ